MLRRTLLGLAASLLLLTGCENPAALAKAAAQEADDLARLISSEHIPARVMPKVQSARVARSDIEAAAAQLAKPVDQVPTEDAWRLVADACEVSDLIEAGESPEAAMDYVAGKSSTTARYRQQAEELVKKLNAADAGGVVWLLAKAALCEAADARAG